MFSEVTLFVTRIFGNGRTTFVAATIFVQENLLPRSSVTENYLSCMRKAMNQCHKNEALVLNRVEKMNAVCL